MEWRIRQTSDGRYAAEHGTTATPDAQNPIGPGYIMPAFVVYESMRFDNRKQAVAYVKRHQR